MKKLRPIVRALTAVVKILTFWVYGRLRSHRWWELSDLLVHQKKYTDWFLSHLSKTAFGQWMWLSSQSTIDDYNTNVPVFTSSDFYQKHVKKAIETNGHNILWDEKISYYGMSSGTTGEAKMIPLPEPVISSLNPRSGIYVLTEAHKVFWSVLWRGDFLPLIWSIQKETQEYLAWDISAIFAWTRHPVYRSGYPINFKVLIDKREVKRDYLIENIELLKHTTIFSGALSRNINLLTAIRDRYAPNWKIHDVLPRFRLLLWWSSDISHYRSQLKDLGIPLSSTMWVYNAAEWMFGYQAIADKNWGRHTDWTPNYTLAPFAYYKFAPPQSIDQHGRYIPWALLYSVADLTDTSSFVLVISAPGQYNILMDRIRINSLDPFRYSILWRAQDFLNITGEELEKSQVDRAIVEWELPFGLYTWTASPDTILQKRHERIIEVENFENAHNLLQEYATCFDQTLADFHHDYGIKRSTIFSDEIVWLWAPHFHFVPLWTFENYMISVGRWGGQSKVLSLSPDRDKFFSGALAYIKEQAIPHQVIESTYSVPPS